MLFSTPGFANRPPIEAYGDGGFRIDKKRVKGSVLILAERFEEWPVADADAITVKSLQPVLDEAESLEILLVGTGENAASVPAGVKEAFAAQNIGIDAMTTGAAARTFNVLLAEERRVAAALIAVA